MDRRLVLALLMSLAAACSAPAAMAADAEVPTVPLPEPPSSDNPPSNINPGDTTNQTESELPDILKRQENEVPQPAPETAKDNQSSEGTFQVLKDEEIEAAKKTVKFTEAQKHYDQAMEAAQQQEAQASTNKRADALAANKLLLEKGLIKKNLNPAQTGQPNTESYDVVEHLQSVLGLYQDEFARSPGDPARVNTGKLTPATVAAIQTLPYGDGSKYTQQDLDTAKAAAQAVLDAEAAAAAQAAAEKAAQHPEKNFTIVPGR